MKILVLHSERAFGEQLASVLNQASHHTLPVCSIHEALMNFGYLDFDLAILFMPPWLGLAVGSDLQILSPTCRVLLVHPEECPDAIRGSFEVLPFPANRDDLLRKLEEIEAVVLSSANSAPCTNTRNVLNPKPCRT